MRVGLRTMFFCNCFLLTKTFTTGRYFTLCYDKQLHKHANEFTLVAFGIDVQFILCQTLYTLNEWMKIK